MQDKQLSNKFILLEPSYKSAISFPHKPSDRFSTTLISHQLHISRGAHALPLSIGSRDHQVNLSHLNVSMLKQIPF